MRTRALHPFGIEIDDWQVSAASPSAAGRLIELTALHRVAVFRNQDADDAAFVRFLKLFGPLTFTAGETPVDGTSDLNIVSNVGRTVPPRSVFHTDTSYVMRPPALTALRAVDVPRAGGSTVFSDQVRAAERLPPRFREALRGRRVRHALKRDGNLEDSVWHPLFRRHPVTNEIALYLSTPERCVALSGADDVLSARAITALYRHSIRSSGLYRHAWRNGDIVVWDDRLTKHRSDHDGVVGDRVLHRGLVIGEVPIAA